jgi:hypothetical protein
MASKQPKTTTKKADEQVNAQANSQSTTQVEPANLTMADLQSLAQIIDVASKRGAFQAQELSQVGATYDKLTGFLRSVAAQQEAAKEEQPQDSPAAE